MNHAYEAHSPFGPASLPVPASPSRQNKADIQKQYREKETECFNMLREVIKELTGEELQTRHGILRKATELLWAVLQANRQREAQATPQAPRAEMISTNFDVCEQTPPLPPRFWQPTTEPVAYGDYTAQPQGQLRDFLLLVDSDLFDTTGTYGQESFDGHGR